MEKEKINQENKMSNKRHLQNLAWEGLFNGLEDNNQKKTSADLKKSRKKAEKEKAESQPSKAVNQDQND